MSQDKCPKCSAKRCAPDLFECKSEEYRDFDSGELTGGIRQSLLCRERCKVAKLKKQVEKLKVEVAYWRDLQSYSEETCGMLIKQISELKK